MTGHDSGLHATRRIPGTQAHACSLVAPTVSADFGFSGIAEGNSVNPVSMGFDLEHLTLDPRIQTSYLFITR
jgi:hypothetical protein